MVEGSSYRPRVAAMSTSMGSARLTDVSLLMEKVESLPAEFDSAMVVLLDDSGDGDDGLKIRTPH